MANDFGYIKMLSALISVNIPPIFKQILLYNTRDGYKFQHNSSNFDNFHIGPTPQSRPKGNRAQTVWEAPKAALITLLSQEHISKARPSPYGEGDSLSARVLKRWGSLTRAPSAP